jgi:L-asparaginase
MERYMLILNTGGTFNKRYNLLNGELEVPFDNIAIEKILGSISSDYNLAGVIYKDSLDMTVDDRKMIANIILHSDDEKFLIIHGTDTMNLTAEFLSEIFTDKTIILTGSMKPFEIDKVESTLNFGMAFGFLKNSENHGVYICMNGYITPWDKINKNKDLGKFEIVK